MSMHGVHMRVHCGMAGVAAILVAGYFQATASNVSRFFAYFAGGLLVFHLVNVAIELTTTHSTDDAHAVVKMITTGEFSNKFWFGMVLAGNILPLLALVLGPAAAAAPA